jgi:hypothetical protein
MHSLPFSICARALLLLAVWLGTALRSDAKFEWSPVPAADLAATSSASAPGADMEILSAHSRMDTDNSRTFVENRIRAKIYTRKGAERISLLSFESEKRLKIWGIMARVVKPDGSSVELTKGDFHDSITLKTGGIEFRRTSFAFPNVQPGDVLEYRWNEDLWDGYGYYIHYCQAEDVPTREFTFEVLGSMGDFTVAWFNCDADPQASKGHKVVLRNLPPFIREPLMPTDTEFRGWIMVQFTSNYMRYFSNADAWDRIGEYLGEQFRLSVKPNRTVLAKAAELTRDGKTDDEKLTSLYHFAQTGIANLDSDEDPSLAEAKKKRENSANDGFQSPAKTLSRKHGNSGDINRLFASLARAVGFDVRLALSADRTRVLRINVPHGWYLTDRESVAVKVGKVWRFYTPGEYLIPAGILGPKDEGAAAFVCDEKKSWFDHMQTATPAETQVKRTGRFTLDAEGTLDGDVTVQSTGHQAIQIRENWWDTSADDATNLVREQLLQRLPTAEVTKLWLEALRDPSRPFTLHYHVHVPGYAEAIGSRLSLPLNFFESNAPAMFNGDLRRYPVFFDFAKEDHDDIDIQLPEDFVLDGATAPAPVAASVIHANYQVEYLQKHHRLVYRRDYVLGDGGAIDFSKESYPALRKLFDRIHRSDSHQLVLKPETGKAVASVMPAATSAQ